MNARAAIFDGAARPLRLATRELPTALGPGEVLVELAMSTICGSDLHTVRGRRSEATPCILGHEGVGRVIAAGAGREAWLSRRVTWTLASSCGACKACVEHGLPQKCRALTKVGHEPLHSGSGWNGTYASHLVLRLGATLVEIPSALPDAVAAPANCALATMVAVTEDLPRSCRVAVIQGAGMLGLYGCALLRSRGVARVVVVDVDPRRLAHVSAFGGEPVRESAIERLGPASTDLVIEVTGDAGVFAEGLALLRPGGAYHLAGLVHPSAALALSGEALVRGCLSLRGFHNYAPRHLERAVAFLVQERLLPWERLVSPPLPLERLPEALELAESREWPRVALVASSKELGSTSCT
ncbi:MAG: alcohol dehydrogenase catalytic domain-containing protein [Planctomycetes bacterium]|nr:alcohol dehydrogenase catalytic domain-containing protein [Planctomycetota bacterium]